jgi:Trk K+ transport system NAD-binding subunit
VIEAGDMLVAIGAPEALERLEGMFQPLAVSSS